MESVRRGEKYHHALLHFYSTEKSSSTCGYVQIFDEVEDTSKMAKQNTQLSTLYKFIAHFSSGACCLKWGSYLSMLEAWLTFISGFQETHLKQSINSVPNRVAISVEQSKI